MNKLTRILIAVLVGQLCLVLFLSTNFLNKDESNSKEKVLVAQLKDTDFIEIVDKSGPSKVELKKVGDVWTVPALMNFPASSKSCQSLISKFTDMEGGWPVATTEEAAKRFKVSKDDFEMSVTYKAKDKELGKVFIGTSPNYKVRHVRSGNSKSIYSVSLPPTDLSTKPKQWIDKSAYTISSSDIAKVTTKDFVLKDVKGRWELDGIATGEVTNQTIARNTVDTLSSIVFKAVEGDKSDPEYGLEAPVISFSIDKKDGTKVDFSIGARKVNDGFILHTSDKKFYVSIDPFVVENIKSLNRVSLVAKETLKDAKAKTSDSKKTPEAK